MRAPTLKPLVRGAYWIVTGSLLVSCGAPIGRDNDTAAGLQIHTVSARPHLVSGGDVLVRIDVTDDIPLTQVSVLVNGEQVTGDLRPEAGQRTLSGLLTGLRAGENQITATTAGAEGTRDASATLDVTNWPITGPMISGPHEDPFHCRTEDFTSVTGEMLGPPLDENCSIATRIDYIYLTTDETFERWPSSGVPADLMETRTMDGRTVPFIVRVETGTVNRAIYESAILHDPSEPTPNPWTRSQGWNGTLVYTHGGGCQGGWYHQGIETGGVLHQGLLADGYAVTSSTLNVFGQNCNDLLASETHLMVKEIFVERYGDPDFTVSTGSSGGSYQSHQTADNYPGVFDGIIVGASFPDVTSATLFTLEGC